MFLNVIGQTVVIEFLVGDRALSRSVIHEALQSKMTDFEDAVLAHSAALANVDAIVTRNPKDFKHSPVKAFEPDEILSVLSRRG